VKRNGGDRYGRGRVMTYLKGLEDSKVRQDLGVILDPGFFETV
jgi:hypothetical protein